MGGSDRLDFCLCVCGARFRVAVVCKVAYGKDVGLVFFGRFRGERFRSVFVLFFAL